MRLFALITFVTLALGCAADAHDHAPGPVTAGPSAPILVEPGGETVISLERASDPAAVFQSDGLIVPSVPTLVSARVGLRGGAGTLAVQLGPRGGPWRTVALAADPALVPPLLVHPDPGDLLRVIVASARGVEVSGSRAGPRQTWVTALPIDPE